MSAIVHKLCSKGWFFLFSLIAAERVNASRSPIGVGHSDHERLRDVQDRRSKFIYKRGKLALHTKSTHQWVAGQSGRILFFFYRKTDKRVLTLPDSLVAPTTKSHPTRGSALRTKEKETQWTISGPYRSAVETPLQTAFAANAPSNGPSRQVSLLLRSSPNRPQWPRPLARQTTPPSPSVTPTHPPKIAQSVQKRNHKENTKCFKAKAFVHPYRYNIVTQIKKEKHRKASKRHVHFSSTYFF